MSNTKNTTLTKLQHELAALKKRLAKLEKNAARGAITCTSLKVVDANTQPVAVIDSAGFLRCRRLLVESPGARSLAFDSVFGELVIRDPGGVVVCLNENATGTLLLNQPPHFGSKSSARLCPAPRLQLQDSKGKTVVELNVSSAGAA